MFFFNEIFFSLLPLGTAIVYETTAEKEPPKELMRLESGHYFGLKSLVFQQAQAATVAEMSMAALPLPPPLPHRCRCGGGGAAAADFLKNHRGASRQR
jgi:hypothetical protein